jgi:predicted transposase/invertase (TIGR01784 family)
VYGLFQIYKDDIDPKVKEVWKMEFRPISELVREIHIRDAREEGMEEGMEKGRAKGKAEGRVEGREEGMAKGKFEVARTMLADGIPVETVRKYTGLDESSIHSLR